MFFLGRTVISKLIALLFEQFRALKTVLLPRQVSQFCLGGGHSTLTGAEGREGWDISNMF